MTEIVQALHVGSAERRTTHWFITEAFVVCLGGALFLLASLSILLLPAEAMELSSTYSISSRLVTCFHFVELFIGMWLVSGLSRSWSCAAAMGLFSLLVLVSFVRALAGMDSCGCFGPITVNPWYMVVINAFIVALLFRVRLGCASPIRSAARLAGTFLYLCLIAALGLITVSRLVVPSNASAIAKLVNTDGAPLFVLDPQTWVGNPLPLIGFLRPQVDGITSERWIVVLYRHSCEKCETALRRYEQRFHNAIRDEPTEKHPRILFVEVPPFHSQTPVTNHALQHVRLADDRHWFVDTPLEIHVSGGIVREVRRDLPNVELTH